MPNYDEPEADINRPFDTLSDFEEIDEDIVVKTTEGVDIRGSLESWDKHINVVVETSNGTAFVRGGSVVSIKLSSGQKLSDL